jgi:hypothetical protein
MIGREALSHFDALLEATTGLDCTDFSDSDGKVQGMSEGALESAAARVFLCRLEFLLSARLHVNTLTVDHTTQK